MKLKFTSVLMVALMAATMVSAQEVDKSKVQSQAAAAQGAQADLKGIDTGEKAWKFSGSLGLNAAATGLWNWTAGGNNNVNGFVYGRFRLLYHENNIAWDTNLDMEYGLTWIDQEYDKLQKSSDKLNFSTKFGWEFEKNWYLTALAGFQSQFAYGRAYTGDAGYDGLISKFLAPSYTDISVGIDYKPFDWLSVYVSPVAGRITTAYVSNKVNEKIDAEARAYGDAHPEDVASVSSFYIIKAGDDLIQDGLRQQLQDKYGVWKFNDQNEKIRRNARAELGLNLKASLNYGYKDLKLSSTLGLFTPYAWDKTKIYSFFDGIGADATIVNLTEEQMKQKGWSTESDNFINDLGYRDNNRRFGNFDVDWTVSVGYQFFNCLQVTLSTDLRYYNGVLIADKNGENAKQRVQFKGVIGLGVGYSF